MDYYFLLHKIDYYCLNKVGETLISKWTCLLHVLKIYIYCLYIGVLYGEGGDWYNEQDLNYTPALSFTSYNFKQIIFPS